MPAFAGEPALPVVTEPVAGQRQAVYGLLRAPTSFDVDAGPTLSLMLPADFKACKEPMRLSGQLLAGTSPLRLKVEHWQCLKSNSPESWLRDLGLASVNAEHKQKRADQLVALGKPAIPLLIAQLQDRRLSETRQMMPGAGLNAPANAPAVKPIDVRVSVGMRAEELLYRLITPAYTSVHAGNFKPYSESLFRVKDWPRWWQAHQHQSLAQIHAALKPRVDQYWIGHGAVQVLD